jgi:NAD(P)-dependent dehydrogenase (short-subunit alcohol dehydrogenase family)
MHTVLAAAAGRRAPADRQCLQRRRVVSSHPAAGTAENAVILPVCPATKAALTMLAVQYARSLPGILVNAADPSFTGTDFNHRHGTVPW